VLFLNKIYFFFIYYIKNWCRVICIQRLRKIKGYYLSIDLILATGNSSELPNKLLPRAKTGVGLLNNRLVNVTGNHFVKLKSNDTLTIFFRITDSTGCVQNIPSGNLQLINFNISIDK